MPDVTPQLLIAQFASYLLENGPVLREKDHERRARRGFNQAFVEGKLVQFLEVSKDMTSVADRAKGISALIVTRWMLTISDSELVKKVTALLEQIAQTSQQALAAFTVPRPKMDSATAVKNLRLAEADLLVAFGWTLVSKHGYFYWRSPNDGHLLTQLRAIGHAERAISISDEYAASAEVGLMFERIEKDNDA